MKRFPPNFTIARPAMAVGFACVLLGACQQIPQKATVDFVEPRPQPPSTAAIAPRVTNGSLFQNSSYRPAFEDRRARMVGDTVTIQIVESLAASQVSKSTLNRNSALDTSVSTIPLPGILGDLGNLQASAKTNTDFSGKGGTEAANTFTGSITATVIDVQPNGHLVVTGEKQIGVNQNVDVMRFSGTIDPRLLQPGSVINSTQVANVRVESRGRGAQGEAQTVGWLSRFFLNFSPF